MRIKHSFPANAVRINNAQDKQSPFLGKLKLCFLLEWVTFESLSSSGTLPWVTKWSYDYARKFFIVQWVYKGTVLFHAFVNALHAAAEEVVMHHEIHSKRGCHAALWRLMYRKGEKHANERFYLSNKIGFCRQKKQWSADEVSCSTLSQQSHSNNERENRFPSLIVPGTWTFDQEYWFPGVLK